MIRQFIFLTVSIFLLQTFVAAQKTNDRREKAKSAGQAILEKYDLPGLQIAVWQNGKIQWSETFGKADLEKNLPVNSDTKFRVGSLSKLLTAAALMRLYDKNLIDLDAPVQKYLPAFPQKKFSITIRALAGHTAGIRHYETKDFMNFGGEVYKNTSDGLRIFQDDELKFEPQTEYFYSSYGYNLLGAAIEAAAKKDFAKIVEDEVLQPLQMKNTTGDLEDAAIKNRAVFYARGADGKFTEAAKIENRHRLPSGGYLSTAEDLAKFGTAFLSDGFLKKKTLETVFTAQKLKNGAKTEVGIGWRIKEKSNDERIFHHGGAIAGGRAFILLDEKSKTVVVLLANLMTDFGEAEAERIAEIFTKQDGK